MVAASLGTPCNANTVEEHARHIAPVVEIPLPGPDDSHPYPAHIVPGSVRISQEPMNDPDVPWYKDATFDESKPSGKFYSLGWTGDVKVVAPCGLNIATAIAARPLRKIGPVPHYNLENDPLAVFIRKCLLDHLRD